MPCTVDHFLFFFLADCCAPGEDSHQPCSVHLPRSLVHLEVCCSELWFQNQSSNASVLKRAKWTGDRSRSKKRITAQGILAESRRSQQGEAQQAEVEKQLEEEHPGEISSDCCCCCEEPQRETMAVNRCVKNLLFFFNLVFWVCGCVILGVGIYLKVTKGGNQITDQYLPSFDLMIAIGAIIMVVGFLGCCGAYKESRCMLLVFFVFLLIIFILLLAAGILAAVGENTVKTWIKDKLEKLTPIEEKSPDVIADMEKLQRELMCCGLINGQSDWKIVPDSCKCNSTAGATRDMCTNGFYNQPCINKIIDYMKTHMDVSLGIAFAVAAILLFGMAFSMMLFCQIGRKNAADTA